LSQASIAAAGTEFSGRWIGFILKRLVLGHFLLRIDLSRSRAVTPRYGLNLPGLLQLIEVLWQNELDFRDGRKDYADQDAKLNRFDCDELLFADDPESPCWDHVNRESGRR
jgi:hypothetical protein